VSVNGRPISAYYRAYESGGRVFAPLRPYLSALVDRAWYQDGRLAIACDGRVVYVVLKPRTPDALDRVYFPIASIARALGARVEYRHGAVEIASSVHGAIASPTPVPSSAMIEPRPIFTPMPLPTTRPIWNGDALPRRTPLPYVSPTPSR
jgi:hypothetical protein